MVIGVLRFMRGPEMPDRVVVADTMTDGTDAPILRADLHTVILVLICVILVFFALFFARPVLVPLMVAVMLRILLWPLVQSLAKFGIPNGLGAALVVAIILGIASYGAYALSGPAAKWISEAPSILAEMKDRLQFLERPVAQMQEAGKSLTDLAKVGTPPAPATKVVTQEDSLGLSVLFGTSSFFIEAGITIVLLYFLLAAGDLFLRKLVNVLPNFGDKRRAVEIAQQMQSDMTRYLIAVTLINVVLGIAVGFAMYFVGMPNPALWGVVAAMLNYVPVLGHVVSTAVIAGVGLMTFHDVVHALLPPVIYIGIAILEGNVLTPAILARRLTLNSVVVFVALVFWGWLWGIPGALLAIPMLSSFKIVCDRVQPLQAVGQFLGR